MLFTPLASSLLRSTSQRLSQRIQAHQCRRFVPSTTRNMQVKSIPMWKGTGNNYAYLVVDDKTKQAAIIDPANPPEVLPVLKEAIDSEKINLISIINTHHHHDHAGGNTEIRDAFSQKLPIWGGKDCDGVTLTPAHEEKLKIGDIDVTALHTPCHTQDSICWFMQDGQHKAVFTGDTLFISGCGRFFEGTAEQMHKALNVVLAGLPDDTLVFPGHEYTKSNVAFALSVSQREAIRKLGAYMQANEESQGQFTIGDEKKHNVFMMLEDPEVSKATGHTEPVEVMAALRKMKNGFKL
ncbi:hypothetical protein VUR80DRAFT_4527 [Thermomyces stellatus]